MSNITRGRGVAGLVNYLASDGREHEQQRVITGSLDQAGDLTDREFRQSIIRDLAAPSLAFPAVRNMHKGVDKPVWHCSLSLGKGDQAPSDAQWAVIAKDFMDGMGFPPDARWVAVGHGLSGDGNPHLHIAANLVTESGARVNVWRDYPRSQEQCLRLERKYGLAVLESRLTRCGVPGLSQAEAARQKQGAVPERFQVRDLVRAATGVASSEAQFVGALRDRGLQVRARRGAGDRVTGYAVALHGSNVWFPGGALGHDLTLDSLRRDWRGQEQPQAVWHAPGKPTPQVVSPAQVQAELTRLERRVSTLDARGLADAAHSLSGALAAAGRTTEARVAAGIAGIRGHRDTAKRLVLSAGSFLVNAADQDKDPQQVAMMRALVRTWNVVQAAHRSVVATLRQEEPMATEQLTARQDRARQAQARIDEQRQARVRPDRSMWDASTIKQYRIAADLERNHPDAFREHSPVEKVGVDQALRIEALSRELGTPVRVEYIDQLDTARATVLERQIEFGLGPEKVAEVDARLAAVTEVHAPQQAPQERVVRVKPAEKWVTGTQDITPAQRGKLLGQGLPPEQIDGLTKAHASQVIDGKVGIGAAVEQSRVDKQARVDTRQAAKPVQQDGPRQDRAHGQEQHHGHRRGA